MNYSFDPNYIPVIIMVAVMIIFSIGIYISLKKAPVIKEEEKVYTMKLSISTDDIQKPKRTYKKRATATKPIEKKPIGRPRKTVK